MRPSPAPPHRRGLPAGAAGVGGGPAALAVGIWQKAPPRGAGTAAGQKKPSTPQRVFTRFCLDSSVLGLWGFGGSGL